MATRPQRLHHPPPHLAPLSPPTAALLDAITSVRPLRVKPNDWVVARLAEEREHDGHREFLVVWARDGNQSFEPTWEPEENISKESVSDWEYYKSIKDVYPEPLVGEGILFSFPESPGRL